MNIIMSPFLISLGINNEIKSSKWQLTNSNQINIFSDYRPLKESLD